MLHAVMLAALAAVRILDYAYALTSVSMLSPLFIFSRISA
jgi:hypothetical protein